ncbi:cytochrome b/b6 domain-containing protein [Leptolyngbya sp. AN03gr2]|uniref:cytochrome b/b6 domain-containing protein n=1 Tax=unclassified Leptolyngbya TaxID=2650499 RepID=UPI003D318539
MARTKPYQPSLLRFLHGVTALLVIGALISGYWVYDTFDARFGQIPLPRINPIIDYHGTIGWLLFFLFAPLFLIYSLWLGRKKLVQKESIAQLTQVGKPIWWISLQRLTNTVMIGALLFAVISGKFMDETWLPQGQLQHVAYSVHLLSWATMLACLALHLLMSAKVGGVPLLLSMSSLKVRPDDHPKFWFQQLRDRV